MNKIFVFDTNVLISSHLLKTSVDFKALNLARKIGSIVCTHETFKEFASCFLRPKFNDYLTIERRTSDLISLKMTMKFISVKYTQAICRDPDDDKFLALAVATSASCIITGDKDLLILNPYENIPILSPAQFLTYFGEFNDSFIVNEPNVNYGNYADDCLGFRMTLCFNSQSQSG